MTTYLRALFDYVGQDGELSFTEGDILILLTKEESDWWEAVRVHCENGSDVRPLVSFALCTQELDGKQGFIPQNYVEELGCISVPIDGLFFCVIFLTGDVVLTTTPEKLQILFRRWSVWSEVCERVKDGLSLCLCLY
jgi:hypothetical protein